MADGERDGETSSERVSAQESGRRAPWMPRPPVRGRLKRARIERDQARADLRVARQALKSAEAELAVARARIEAEHSEKESVQSELVAARSEAASLRADLQKQSDAYRDTVDARIAQIGRQQEATARTLRYMPRELLTDIQAMVQLRDKYHPESLLPPVAGWALGPAGLLAVADQIERHRAQLVVECGSGTSTLWMGYALKRLGRGRVIALDHLTEYAERTRAIVADHGLEEYVDVRIAPLVPRATTRGEYMWYDFDTVELDSDIDVLLVDGPPGATGQHARYPALPMFADRLSDGATIIVDDMDRRDEREIVEFWLEDDRRLSRMGSPGRGVELLGFQTAAANTGR